MVSMMVLTPQFPAPSLLPDPQWPSFLPPKVSITWLQVQGNPNTWILSA